MSQNLLEIILKNKLNHDTNKLINFLLLFKKNDFIYPSTIKNKFNYNSKEIYEIFNLLEKKHLVKMYYELFCYNCGRSVKLYETFNQIEETIMCNFCDSILTINKNNIKIIYKVIG